MDKPTHKTGSVGWLPQKTQLQLTLIMKGRFGDLLNLESQKLLWL